MEHSQQENENDSNIRRDDQPHSSHDNHRLVTESSSEVAWGQGWGLIEEGTIRRFLQHRNALYLYCSCGFTNVQICQK